MSVTTQDKLAIIKKEKDQFETALWQAEKVDLAIAQKLKNKAMENQAVEQMKICQTAIAMLDELALEITQEARKEADDASSSVR